ncbi:MazG-like family protein [Streptomyces sp. NPDC057620]|uniref:MazG-like family protein n=1 Tax=Streptomyces liliiviolaceus TaxID=2823109 RepID=A0A940XTW3_9ACTN|nr:MazG-like family protein [Streptomyces liliiviolaceus]MBQ0849488.1 MazG-like family protein [Streptomyces liliiviolaceus]
MSDDGDLWQSIEHLQDWLARTQPDRPPQETLLLRMLKLSEEVGEVAEAVIGATGQNPRKGVSHTWDDVRAELCDVIITAAVALRTLSPDAQQIFTTHLARVTARSQESDTATPGKPL